MNKSGMNILITIGLFAFIIFAISKEEKELQELTESQKELMKFKL